MSRIPSASQTVGPFFNFALTTDVSLGVLAAPGTKGDRIQLRIRVLDAAGDPTPGDSMIELWQADASGRYPHPLDPQSGGADPHFRGFGRLETSPQGVCTFETVRPGALPPDESGTHAPHITVTVFARGLLRHLHTRIYFDGDPRNGADPVLSLVPEARRQTLIAVPDPDTPGLWCFDIHLQGDQETVFFDA